MTLPPRPPRPYQGAASVWIAGLLVAVLGIGFAVVETLGGEGGGTSADSSFGGAPTAPPDSELIAPPPTVRAQPVPGTSSMAGRASQPASKEQVADAAARARQADALIARLLKELRAERRAKAKARARRRSEQARSR